jgi:hypothetical protein
MPDEPRDEIEDNNSFSVPVQHKRSIEPINDEDTVRGEQAPADSDATEPEEPQMAEPEPIPIVEAEHEPATLATDTPASSESPSADVPAEKPEPSEQPLVAPVSPAEPPVRKRNKRLIVGGVLALALVLLGSSAALAYTLWYQNPQKVLGDAIAHSITAKSISIDSTLKNESKLYMPTVNDSTTEGVSAPETGPVISEFAVKATANYEIAQLDIDYSSKDAADTTNIGGSAVLDYKNSSYYVKVKALSELLELVVGPADQAPPEVTSLLEKLDANWIKITDESINEFSQDVSSSNISSCVQSAVEKINKDESYKNELVDLYRNNQILIVSKKLGSQDGLLGYEIEPSHENTNGFIAGFNTSQFYTEVKKCDDSIKDIETIEETDSSDDSDGPVVSVWIDRWSHELKKLTVDNNGEYTKSNFVAQINLNQPVEATAPANTIDIKTLKKDIEAAQAALEKQNNFGMGASDASDVESVANNVSKKAEVYNIITAKYPTYAELTTVDGDVPEAELDAEIAEILTPDAPTTESANLVQYEQCSEGKGATVRYFNEATNKVEEIVLGECLTA